MSATTLSTTKLSSVLWYILALMCGLSGLYALEIPDVVAVAITIDNFEVKLDGPKRAWQTHTIEMWPKQKWIDKFGQITKEDEDEYWQFGCLRFHTVLHHYDI